MQKSLSMSDSDAKSESELSFQKTQRQFAAHIRHPDLNAAPNDLEDRRLKIYRDLFFNNIESFLASGFPVLKSIIEPYNWLEMVRDFVYRHHSHSPYFLQISEEFLSYLQQEREPQPSDPVFMLELAHYEWVELALDVSTLVIPSDVSLTGDVLQEQPVVSPTAWRFSYQYPVHKIGPDYQPNADNVEPGGTVLIVYRNRDLKVGFIESNPVTVRLLEILETEQLSGRASILRLAKEINHPQPESLLAFGEDIIYKLMDNDVICGFRRF